MKYDFSDKVVAITGVSGIGMGVATSKAFFASGAKLAICSSNEERVQKAAAEIGASDPDRVFAMKCDLGEEDGPQRFIDATIARYGRIDILVQTAAINPYSDTLACTVDEFTRCVNIKLRGYYFVMQAAIKDMLQRKEGGAIINIGSMNAQFVGNGSIPYAATNAGVAQMSRCFANQFGPDQIRINCIQPGSFPSTMSAKKYSDPEVLARTCSRIPLRRRGDVREIANTILFLASDDASYITGQVFNVDGGYALT